MSAMSKNSQKTRSNIFKTTNTQIIPNKKKNRYLEFTKQL